MSLIIKNLETGDSQTIVSGGTADVFFTASSSGSNIGGAARLVFIDSDHVLPTFFGDPPALVMNTPNVSAVATGDIGNVTITPRVVLDGVPTGTIPDTSFHVAATLSLIVPTAPGTYFVAGVLFDNNSSQSFILRCRVLPAFNLHICPPLSWIPTDLFDLVADLNLRTVRSAVLSRLPGVKQGDDITIAAVLLHDAAEISDDLDAISLVLLPEPGSEYSPIVLEGIEIATAVSTHHYYEISGTLNGPQLQQWFDDANDKALKDAAPGADPLPVDRLEIFAELHVTRDGEKITTESFPFPILQALKKP